MKNMTKIALIPIFISILPDIVMAMDSNTSLRVEISDIRSGPGDIGCFLFNSADGFPEDHGKANRILHVPIKGSRALCEFKNLAPDIYAVVVVHDENSNGKLDKNLLGIPQEGYMASNNERPIFSPPRFSEASFTVSENDLTTIKIGMRY